MSTVSLTVHRATQQIGGNCIEIATKDSRIVLDVGRPLNAPNEATGLLPATLDLTAPADGVLISHPHQDHYGLLEDVPASWPVYSGAATASLIKITTGIFGNPLQRDYRHWRSGSAIPVGSFLVTPYLTDHSAFDAHMLLIETNNRRILYSGDFRIHGRKSKLVERMMRSPPEDIDVLLMEGTNLGSDKPCVAEDELEEDFVSLFRETKGRVFVAWSAQNIDRTVTLYRACLKAGRTLVIDLYTAEILRTLAAHGRLPQPDWPSMKVVITSAFARMYRRKGQGDFVDEMVPHGMSAKRLVDHPENWVIMVRPSLIRDYEPAGVRPTPDDAWSWSMWRGYLRNEDGKVAQRWFDSGGAVSRHIHTSGHASSADLRAFAKAIDPRAMVPIHGVAWDDEWAGFPTIRRLADGEQMAI